MLLGRTAKEIPLTYQELGNIYTSPLNNNYDSTKPFTVLVDVHQFSGTTWGESLGTYQLKELRRPKESEIRKLLGDSYSSYSIIMTLVGNDMTFLASGGSSSWYGLSLDGKLERYNFRFFVSPVLEV